MPDDLDETDNKVATQCAMRIVALLSSMQDDTSGEIEFWGRIVALQKATCVVIASYAVVNGAKSVPQDRLVRAYAETVAEAIDNCNENRAGSIMTSPISRRLSEGLS